MFTERSLIIDQSNGTVQDSENIRSFDWFRIEFVTLHWVYAEKKRWKKNKAERKTEKELEQIRVSAMPNRARRRVKTWK